MFLNHPSRDQLELFDYMDEQEVLDDLQSLQEISTFGQTNFEVQKLKVALSDHHLDDRHSQVIPMLKKIHQENIQLTIFIVAKINK